MVNNRKDININKYIGGYFSTRENDYYVALINHLDGMYNYYQIIKVETRTWKTDHLPAVFDINYIIRG